MGMSFLMIHLFPFPPPPLSFSFPNFFFSVWFVLFIFSHFLRLRSAPVFFFPSVFFFPFVFFPSFFFHLFFFHLFFSHHFFFHHFFFHLFFFCICYVGRSRCNWIGLLPFKGIHYCLFEGLFVLHFVYGIKVQGNPR